MFNVKIFQFSAAPQCSETEGELCQEKGEWFSAGFNTTVQTMGKEALVAACWICQLEPCFQQCLRRGQGKPGRGKHRPNGRQECSGGELLLPLLPDLTELLKLLLFIISKEKS